MAAASLVAQGRRGYPDAPQPIAKLFSLSVGSDGDETGEPHMALWKPDASFYPSPRMAMKAPPETVAYVAAFDPSRQTPDGIAVVDVDPASPSYSKILGTVAMPNVGDELHHFGWN